MNTAQTHKPLSSVIRSVTWQSFLILSLSFVLATNTKAQSALGLTAIPPRLEVTVAPGGTITKEIKVRNESKVERVVSTLAKDFIVTDDKGTPIQIEGLDETDNRWAASSWIQISPSNYKLKPGETKSLMVTIIAPDNPTAGGHYAMILHTPKNEVSLSETGSAIETFVGSLVYITIPGPITEKAQVKLFSAPSFLEFGPVNFRTIITNLSDIHIAPVGAINIKNWFGGMTASLPLTNTNIFPMTSREFQNTLSNKWLFGRYKATLEAGYGTTGQALTAALIFWVIPWKLLVLVVAAVIIAILLVTLLRQKGQMPPTQTETKVEELEQELEELKKKYQDRK
jgi:hypothetical protein